jgi:large subunit ribosomal protein L22
MKASNRFVRVSPFKLRRVAGAIRGRNVNEAIALCRHMNSGAAPVFEKLLTAALANAASNDLDGVLDLDALVVGEVQVNQGPTLKRIRYKAKGMFGRIRKMTSRVRLYLAEPAAAETEE